MAAIQLPATRTTIREDPEHEKELPDLDAHGVIVDLVVVSRAVRMPQASQDAPPRTLAGRFATT
jgi:hypothetical protein